MAVYAFRHPPTRRVASPGESYHPHPGYSPEELSDRDLVLAILGRRGSQRFTALPPDGLLDLTNLCIPALADSLEVTPAAAWRVGLAVELHRRLLRCRIPDRMKIAAPEDVARIMAPWADLDHERFWCLPLDARCRLIGDPVLVSVGDVAGTEAGPRTFYRGALRRGAVSVIAAHNHPTGDPTPSPEDRRITRRLHFAGKTLDIALSDHVIVGPGRASFSFRRESPEIFAG